MIVMMNWEGFVRMQSGPIPHLTVCIEQPRKTTTNPASDNPVSRPKFEPTIFGI
jgi:hypothetical protein